jgi:hypothetical protein
MSFYEAAVDSPYYHINIVCPVASCKRGITQNQSAFECGYCKALYHPSCKGIIGSAKIKKAIESNWLCSPDCIKSAASVIAVPSSTSIPSAVTSKSNSSVTPNVPNVSVISPCGSAISCEAVVNGMMKRIDDQFAAIKLMITDIRTSQDFICNEFDTLKTEFKSIVAVTNSLKEKYDLVQPALQQLEDRINKIEFGIDTEKQSKLNSNLIVAGLPDKLMESNDVTINLLKALHCEDLISEVISSAYMPSPRNLNATSYSPEDVKILICFKDIITKKKLILLKKKHKPQLYANDIGLQRNFHQLNQNQPNSNVININQQHYNKQIYFRDHLTGFRHTLYREARQLKKVHNYKYLWINDGNILFRKAEGSRYVAIQSRSNFNKITGS